MFKIISLTSICSGVADVSPVSKLWVFKNLTFLNLFNCLDA